MYIPNLGCQCGDWEMGDVGESGGEVGEVDGWNKVRRGT